MPIYEYKCQDCGEEFECLILGSEAPDDCPSCKGDRVTRLLSACSFVSKNKSGEKVRSTASSCSGCSGSTCSTCSH